MELSASDREKGRGIDNNTQMASVSEKAGQRLYLQALKAQKKLEETRKSHAASIMPQLDMATRRHKSTKLQHKSHTPRYLQLYESFKMKQVHKESTRKTQFTRVVAPNECCNRLYALSKKMQQKGKERREEIKKSKVKPLPPPDTKKIPIDQAAKIYDRGMQYLISLEIKRIEAGMRRGETYNSKLVDVKWTT